MGSKIHLKNINDQNFVHFMRGYDKGGLRQRLLRYVIDMDLDQNLKQKFIWVKIEIWVSLIQKIRKITQLVLIYLY